MKPFLKWVGGKTQILDQVLAAFPNRIDNYYEPFVGGGSVLLAVLSRPDILIQGRIYASDVNPHLISVYTAIQQDVEGFLCELKELCDVFHSLGGHVVHRDPATLEDAKTSRESYYYWIRKQMNEQPRPAMFVFLNKTCFRGVYREGPRGFNVPYGHYKQPAIFDPDHLRAVSRLLQRVVFSVCSFETALQGVQAGDFVYLDPPYVPLNTTSFTSYVRDGFDKHEELFRLCKQLPSKFLMSNHAVQLVCDSFPEPTYKAKRIPVRRAIHSKDPSSTVDEVLVSN